MVDRRSVAERKSVAEMLGEWMREASVLVAVFGILDKLLRGEGPTSAWTVAVLAVALSFFSWGCIIERRRLS